MRYKTEGLFGFKGKSIRLWDKSKDEVWDDLLIKLGLTNTSDSISLPGIMLLRSSGDIEYPLDVMYDGMWISGRPLKAAITQYDFTNRKCTLSLLNIENKVTRKYQYSIYTDNDKKVLTKLVVTQYFTLAFFKMLLSPIMLKVIARDAN